MTSHTVPRLRRGVARLAATTLVGALAMAGAGAAAATPALGAAGNRPVPVDLVDDRATAESRSLFAYLRDVEGDGILFGHQHDITHGATFDEPDGTSSDTLAAVGDHPAVFGWDTLILQGRERPGVAGASDQQNIEALSWAIEHGDALGGINTLSAHFPNFVTGGDYNDTSGQVVAEILPGGKANAEFTAYLDRIAAAVTGAQRPDGTAIPVIFRPFHENNGGWFWWGAGHATSAQYIELFRYTVEYLRDTKQVHNLLYAYSPNASFGGDPTGYLRTYPGDEFVDVLGFDAYDGSAGSPDWLSSLTTDLAMVVRLAEERGKVPAFTEFGESGDEGRNPNWFTDLLSAIKADPQARRVAFMLTWANFGEAYRAYVPYPGDGDTPDHVMLPDFVDFHADPYSLFADDVRGAFDRKTKAVRDEPVVHLVTPTDRQRVTTDETVIRVRVTDEARSRVTYSVDGGEEIPLTLDEDGFYSGVWSIDPSWLDNRSVELAVTAEVRGKTLKDSARVLLGDVVPLAAGWVDDFEGYAGDDITLSEAYSHVNANTTTLSTEHKATGEYGLAYGYDFSSAGYTGIGTSVGADWSEFSNLALWLKGDGSDNGATLQVVAGGVYFEYGISLASTDGREVFAPFSDFRPAPWDTANAGARLDAAHLANVTAFNLYLGHGGGAAATTGVVYVDDIRAE